MATKQIILTENIPGLGAEADLVTVRAGYANNFLLPRSMAYEVTPTTLRQLNRLKAKRADREQRELGEAEELARKINKMKLVMELATGTTGKAFGSITNQDLGDRVSAELGGVPFDRHRIQLERPIKETGDHEIPVKLHHDVIATLKVRVESSTKPVETARSGEEDHDD